MKYKFNYEKDTYEDSIIVEGVDLKTIIAIIDKIIKKRKWDKSCIWEERLE